MSDSGSANHFAPPRAPVEDAVAPGHDVDTMIEATRMSRFLAFLVDVSPWLLFVPMVIIGLGWQFLVALYAAPGSVDFKPIASWLGIWVLGIFVFSIASLVSVYRRGQTLGKRALGIRVVRTDGSRVSFARFIFIRWLPTALLGSIPWIGRVVTIGGHLMIVRNPARCLHDDIAGTMVVTAESSPYATLEGSRGDHLRTISF
jgi:uncharacterized RDD family membrane protein YckC